MNFTSLSAFALESEMSNALQFYGPADTSFFGNVLFTFIADLTASSKLLSINLP